MDKDTKAKHIEELLENIVKGLIDSPEEIKITQNWGTATCIMELEVAKADVGKVIGKGGRIAKALRVIISAAGTKLGVNVKLEILDLKEK